MQSSKLQKSAGRDSTCSKRYASRDFSIDPLERRVLLSGNLFIVTRASDGVTGSVGEYTAEGATVKASLISGLSDPYAIAVSGSDLFVSNGDGVISEYTTAGKLVNANFITSVLGATRIAVSGSDLFVNTNGGYIAEFTTSGAVVNRRLITGVPNAFALAVSGSDIFVVSDNSNTSPNTGKVGEYSTSGATINSDLISGLNGPDGITVDGSDLFVSSSYDAQVGEFTTSGATVNRALLAAGNIGDPADVAASGSDLYVSNNATFSEPNNGVAEFTTAGGTVNASLISIPVAGGIYRIAIGPAIAAAPALEVKIAGTLPATVKPGKKATIEPKITVTNISGALFDATLSIHLYISASDSLSGAILLPGKFAKALKLKAGAHDSFSLSLSSIPSTVPAGTYHIVAKITDANGDSVVAASKVTVRVT